MPKCSTKGRGCIEKNSIQDFNCSVTCEGIYADVHWEDVHMYKETDEGLEDELDLDFNHNDGSEKHKEMYRKLIDNIEKRLRQKGKKGEGRDKKKFLRLVSEYKKFKRNNVQHLRFNSAATSTMFGKSQS